MSHVKQKWNGPGMEKTGKGALHWIKSISLITKLLMWFNSTNLSPESKFHILIAHMYMCILYNIFIIMALKYVIQNNSRFIIYLIRSISVEHDRKDAFPESFLSIKSVFTTIHEHVHLAAVSM